MEEITTPIQLNPPKQNLNTRKRRSLIITIGLPLLTILIISLTTKKENSSPKVQDSKKLEKTETSFDPALLSSEIQAYYNGELDIAEQHCLNSFYKDPFNQKSINSEKAAKSVHAIKITTENFLNLFSKNEIKKGVTLFRQLKFLDSKLRMQFNIPFIGGWAEQIQKWEGQIEKYAEKAYLEGYALLRTSPRDALEKYRLALFISQEKSKINKKAQDAIRNLGLGLD